ncbi:hypothetical protein IFR05_014336 [Cadophora sp. M221]|nr:hypothetical protein IFR05_014336 [Cadophora sp. M221]
MLQDRLNDAVMSLSRVLSDAGIKFGIFGGYAIAVLGGQRESKDIDCVAALSKQAAVNLLDGDVDVLRCLRRVKTTLPSCGPTTQIGRMQY